MSEFNHAIARAKKQQRARLIAVSLIAAVIVAVSLLAILASQGTRIHVQPDDAAAEANIRTEQGVAMVIAGQLYSLSAEPVISVTSPGFKTATQTIQQQQFGRVTIVTLEPLPGQLQLSSSASDDKTQWYINDGLVAMAASIDQTLQAGSYKVELRHPYFEPLTQLFNVERGETITDSLTLTPISGTLTIDTTPAGAVISVDETEQGPSPLTLDLAGGLHHITVAHSAFEPTVDTVDITNSKPDIQRHYQLQPKRAHLTVSVSPAGGTFTVNGIATALTDVIKIPANKQSTLTYAKPGYISQTQRVTLTAEQSQHMDFALEKEMGRVEIQASPRAQVRINGNTVGQTPLTLNLNALPQQIELVRLGYRTFSKKITPSAQSVTRVSATLLTEKQARLQAAPKRYTSQAGDEMVLFVPNDSVTMGAERSEPGQRANEFVKTVSINRPFYAGLHEVTNAAYAQFDSSHTGSPKLPVTNLSWLDAARYSNWLSQREGLQPVYVINHGQLSRINAQADGYRLLTEAEWEWLARKAGRQTQTLFVWGNDKTLPPKSANIADESAKNSVREYVPRYDDGQPGMAPVMSMNPELSGLFDMGGNVSEWTHDSYTLTVPTNATRYNQTLDTNTSDQRVVKGASWRSGSLTELRASYREGLSAAKDDLGFRLGRFVYGGE